MKAAVAFIGFKHYNTLQQNFHGWRGTARNREGPTPNAPCGDAPGYSHISEISLYYRYGTGDCFHLVEANFVSFICLSLFELFSDTRHDAEAG